MRLVKSIHSDSGKFRAEIYTDFIRFQHRFYRNDYNVELMVSSRHAYSTEYDSLFYCERAAKDTLKFMDANYL